MKKKVLIAVIISFLVFLLILIIDFVSVMGGKTPVSISEYIYENIGIDITSCNILKDNDEHGGFLGDGQYIVTVDCSDNFENVLNQVSSWNALPLTENLHLIMYGGKKNGTNYSFYLAEKNGIPEINNGYYLFEDRHRESTNMYSDEDLLGRYSFNFTLALYDNDTNYLYYYEFDT